MGGLLIKNKELRCKDCFNLFIIKIKPDFPTCKISKACKCSTTEMEIPKFLSEYKKNKNLSISCSQCKKTSPKEPKYCHECKKLFCSNCSKSFHNEKDNNKNHRLIVIEKYDFFCVCHQNDNFFAYCKNCKLDICAKCEKEKRHEGHKVLNYKKIYDEKKMREYLKKAIQSSEVKMEYNKTISQMISKELKNKEIAKNLRTLKEINENENRKMIELINILYEIYDISKNKNYPIIINMIDNMDFNFERITFEKNTTKEKDAQSLIDYFKTDFVLKSDLKEKKQPSTLEEQFFNDSFNQFDKEKKEEGVEAKKEENAEKKEEGTEAKKEENVEKKEENAEEKKEEEKEEEDDGHVKTIKEKKEIIEKKINEKGGFQQGEANPNTTKNNDIISAPTSDVVNVINSQTIVKKAKKKPRKINFQS